MHEIFENIDYNNCITNITSSIQKHFGLKPFYTTNKLLDEKLSKKDYKNIVIVLFDGMGNAIIDKNTDENNYLRTHRVDKVKSTYPPTTANCTTSFVTGLNPITTGWLGWSTYYEDLGVVIDNFPNRETFYKNIIEGENIARKRMPLIPLGRLIEEQTNHEVTYHTVWPTFGEENKCKTLREFRRKIISILNEPGKKYMYAYWADPDATMHLEGTCNKHIKKILDNIAYSLSVLEKKCKDTLFIVTADHGQVDVNPIILYTYYDVMDCLKVPYSCDSRTPFFFVKDGKDAEFKELFEKYFSDKYYLFSKQEIKDMKIFGDGKENPLYDKILGDYIGVAKGNNYFMLSPNSGMFKGAHAGPSIDEMSIPIILIEN